VSARPGAARRPDLRLAGVALGTWLSGLAALHTGAATAIGTAVAAAVLAAAGAWLLTRRAAAVRGSAPVTSARDRALPLITSSGWARWRVRRRWPRDRAWAGAGSGGWVGLAVLLGVVCGSAATAARVAARDAEPLASLAARGVTVRADLMVRDDPRRVGGSGRVIWLVPADLTRFEPVHGPVIRLDTRILVLAADDDWRALLPGQRVVVRGRLMPSRGGDLRAAVLSVAVAPERIGRPGWAQQMAGTLRAGLQRACAPLPDEPGGLLPGLVVGDVTRLPPAVAEDFRATGLTHLVAVSGANVAIVVGLVMLLARFVRAGPRASAAACGVALIGFVILARPSPSVVRAAAMGAIGLLALASGRSRAAVPALGAAVTALVVFDPELAGHPGFALSVLATAGLLLLAPRWRDGMRVRGVPPGVAEAIAVPAAAQVACGPVVAALSGSVSAVAVPANLLAVPAIAPATVLGVAAAVVSPVWPATAEFLAWLAGWPARWLVTVARHGADLPAGTLPWPAGVPGGLLLAALTAGLLMAGRWPVVRRVVAVVAVAVVVGALPVRLVAAGWPPAGWAVVACAVGQGDAAVLPAGRGRAVVIDTGPDPAAADRCLRRLGVRRVLVLVVSHFHVDHIGGIDGVFRGRRVDAVATTAWPEPAAGRAQVLRAAAAGRAAVRQVGAGWSYVAGELRLSVIGPARPLRGTRSDVNNNSLVLRATVGGVDVLLAGDAEGEEQRALMAEAAHTGLRAQVLKLAHHGSAYQDPGFLDAVDPSVVIVSVGAGNRYGHPNASVLARLARGGARILRTDTDGDVAAVRVSTGLAVVARGVDPATRHRGR
jgi:competence protein ComEC